MRRGNMYYKIMLASIMVTMCTMFAGSGTMDDLPPLPTGDGLDWSDIHNEADAFARFNRLREEGLARLAVFNTEDHLKGFAERAVVERVCDPIRDIETRQMCKVRGRRMGQRLLNGFKKGSLERRHADRFVLFSKAYYTGAMKLHGRVRIVNGKVHSWEHLLREHFIMGMMLGTLKRVERSGGFGNRTFEMLFNSDDKCFDFGVLKRANRFQYPSVVYASAPHCPEQAALMWLLERQTSVPAKDPKNNVPFEQRDEKLYFRGSSSRRNIDRIYFAALALTKKFPWLDVKLTDQLDWERDFCPPDLKKVKRKLKDGSEVKAMMGPHLCSEKYMWGKVDPYDDRLKHKYQLNVDGLGALFRLGTNLQSNAVNFLYKNKGYDLPFDLDMVPYVHFIPLPIDLQREEEVLDALKHSYNWLERNKETAKNIAEESTRWGTKFADQEAFARDFQMYAAWLEYLQKPDFAKSYEGLPKMDFPSCDSPEHFKDFAKIKLDDRWAKITHRLACLDPAFDLAPDTANP